jgi:CRP-like cAMP-binding protein/small-conductance mechanosensitive channel
VLLLILSISVGYRHAIDWAVEGMPSMVGALSVADSAVRAIAIIVVCWATVRLLHDLLIIGVIERRIKAHVPEILVGLVAGAIYLIGFFVIATEILGMSAPVVLAAAAGLLILLGAPFRTLIEDIVAGVVLSFDRSFGIGAIVETPDGRVGKVRRLGVAGMALLLPDGSTSVVRNSTIARQGYVLRARLGNDLRQSLTVTLPHHVAAPRAIRLLKGAALATKGIGETQDPQVLIDDISETSVAYRLSYGVPDLAEAERIRSQIGLNVLRHLNQAGLSLMIPLEAPRVFDDQAPSWDSIDVPLILDRLSIFSVLRPDERAILAKNALPRSLPEGAMVCRKGEAGGALFVLAEGVLEVTDENQDGLRIRIARVEPGDCVGEMSLLTGEPRSADVFARSPVLILEICSEHLSPILENRPALAEMLASLMIDRQRAREEAMSASGLSRPQVRADLVGQIAQRIRSFLSGLRR